MKKRLLTILLTAVLAVSLVACGKGETSGNYEDPSYSEENGAAEGSLGIEASGQTSEKKNKDSKESKDGSFTIYRVDGSKLHFCLQSDKCETMVPEEEYGEGKSALIVMIENSNNAQFNATSSYASYGYDDNGGWVNVSAPYENGYTCFRNMYAATFEGDNLFNGFKDGDSFSAYVVDQNNWDISDKTLAVSGKIKIEDISSEEFAKILVEEAKNYAPSKKASDVWVGNYFTDYYDYNSEEYVYGYAIVEVTEAGAISLSLTTPKGTEGYILEETEFDEAHYDYGDVITGRAKEPGRNSGAELNYSVEPGYSYMNFSTDINGQYISYGLYEYKGGEAASADVPDKDQYGKVDAFVKSMPSSLLPGGTDDYVVQYTDNESAYVYSGNDYVQYPCELYRVYAFDVNGLCSSYSYVYCLENDGAAAAVYNYQIKNGATVNRNGNTVYASYGDYYQGKKDLLNNFYYYEIYPGMHYAYPEVYEGSEPTQNTLYISKPETEEQLSFEEIAKLRMKEYGSHRSVDSQDASLSYSFYYDTYESTYSFSLYVYANDFDSADNIIKMVGEDKFVSMGYSHYNGYICVNEYDLSGDEGIVTQYKYKCDDFTNPSVTFDNYKSQTPEETVSHRFDMTRVE